MASPKQKLDIATSHQTIRNTPDHGTTPAAPTRSPCVPAVPSPAELCSAVTDLRKSLCPQHDAYDAYGNYHIAQTNATRRNGRVGGAVLRWRGALHLCGGKYWEPRTTNVPSVTDDAEYGGCCRAVCRAVTQVVGYGASTQHRNLATAVSVG